MEIVKTNKKYDLSYMMKMTNASLKTNVFGFCAFNSDNDSIHNKRMPVWKFESDTGKYSIYGPVLPNDTYLFILEIPTLFSSN